MYCLSENYIIFAQYLIVCCSDLNSWNLMQKVESRVRILSDLRELASAESLDVFTLIYTNILEHQPDCPVTSFTDIFSIFYVFNTNIISSLAYWVSGCLVPNVFICGVQPEVVEKLVALREGIPRKDAKEVFTLSSAFDSITSILFVATWCQYKYSMCCAF